MAASAASDTVRIKDIGRFGGWRDNMLVGYGVATGLAGTGDSARSRSTRQSIANVLSQFDVVIPPDQVQSRNVAVVMITATLPPFARNGDRLDVTVTSMGDARSLLGGVLLMTPLKASRYTQVTHLPFEEPELWRRHPQCAEVRSKEFWPPVRHRFCDQGSRLTMQSDGSFG